MKQCVCMLVLFLSFNYGHAIGQTTVDSNAITFDTPKELEEEYLSDTDFCPNSYKADLVKFDLGPLWTHTENEDVYGFIGKNYQRLRIKIISVVKDKKDPDIYNVVGKSMVKNNICRFSGIIKISGVAIYKKGNPWVVYEEYKNKGVKEHGFLFAGYRFYEDSTQPYSGIFEGCLVTEWYIDKNGHVQYDDIVLDDTFHNNQFKGSWRGYKSTVIKICEWGDFRISGTWGYLDHGAESFYPDAPYVHNGWETCRDRYDNKKAMQEEKRQWWK